ncbi:DNA-3-methyladenine glycosylase [Corallococcus sp. AB030]|uniref:DNA-3-methyladenine glycosylase n=1 Tax=Corallococcus TaxID=83461 RepID=UPI000EE101CD|nr:MULTISPECIES: DNA-3-methyladenine glycosylase [Corallococcus]NRD53563.1 DNA-3-methyladenine glycosylase [Corallococcus exiguus]RKI16384.1 DNA-3-methyladenine glycosylase [Corallococcus sp. AB030]
MSPLPLSFYARPTLEVARDLLGTLLVVDGVRGRRVGRIVEVEAYLGEHDLACHSSKGRTPRTEVMFGPAGRSYVYLIYGMHHCFNVVTDAPGVAAAVLVRGVEPVEGIPPGERTDGPGKLCRVMGLNLNHNGLTLDSEGLYLSLGTPVPDVRVERGPRIGVEYAGAWAAEPFRLWDRDSGHVSRFVSRRPRRRP